MASDPRSKAMRQLSRRMKTTCVRWDLLAPGDRILVAISGGKDSYAMLTLLHDLVPRLPFEVELTAVHLDQVQPGYDGRPLVEWLEARGYRYEVLREDTYSVVMDRLGDGGATYCSLCSRLRRGILYTAAERLGCNKIALGHHREDTLETLLMNLFYAGKMQAMPAVYTTDDGRFQVIRPLLECDEATIRTFAEEQAFPILPCNLCGSQDGLKRQKMKSLLGELEQDHPHLRSVMLNAIRNVCPTHLLDPDVVEAWAERPEHIPAKQEAKATARRAAAEPVAASDGKPRLPLV